MPQAKKSSTRFAFIDWTRGVAAILMLNGHVFHSFMRDDLRTEAPYVLTQFIGGMPPAIFLFLVGVTLAFMMDSRQRQGVPASRRVKTAIRRGGYLFGVAVLFRIQMFVFGLPDSRFSDLFRVDILNAMGFAIVAMSGFAVLRTAQRVRACALAGLAIAFASPLVSMMNWSAAPAALRDYIAPSSTAFAFFPWGAFVALGMSVGSVIRLAAREQMGRIMYGSAWLGLILIIGARFCSNLPYSMYPASDYWLNGPWLILTKTGVILLLLSFAYLWTTYGAGPGWSWVRQFGRTSLLVYWVHTELVYGRWLWRWKNNLDLAQVLAASAAVILTMLALSLLRTNWDKFRNFWRIPQIPYWFPRRVPGD